MATEIHTLPLSEALDLQGVDLVLNYIEDWCNHEADNLTYRATEREDDGMASDDFLDERRKLWFVADEIRRMKMKGIL